MFFFKLQSQEIDCSFILHWKKHLFSVVNYENFFFKRTSFFVCFFKCDLFPLCKRNLSLNQNVLKLISRFKAFKIKVRKNNLWISIKLVLMVDYKMRQQSYSFIVQILVACLLFPLSINYFHFHSWKIEVSYLTIECLLYIIVHLVCLANELAIFSHWVLHSSSRKAVRSLSLKWQNKSAYVDMDINVI